MAPSPAGVLVCGSGIAASCCRRLLAGQCAARSDPTRGGKLPALLISPSTQNLLADIFQSSDLFNGAPLVRKRVVAWGGKEVVTLPHSGVVIAEQAIRDRLQARILAPRNDLEVRNPAWTLRTAKPPDPAPAEMHFGSRKAVASEVALAEGVEGDACWVESIEGGWLFLLPMDGEVGSLVAVGSPTEQLLEKSHLVRRQVRRLGSRVAEFAAYPRVLSKLCGEGWLACGTAAMSFDPLCGEGAGHAAREAILASAAVKAILAGEPQHEVLAEYSLRLRLGFLRHLEHCREFYSGRGGNQFWSSELSKIEEGMAWTKSQLALAPRPRFRLIGFGLERVADDEPR